MNKGKLIDTDKLKRRISLTRLLNTENKIHIKDIIDELSEDKVVTDNSKVNTNLLKRVEELEAELNELKQKLKDLILTNLVYL